MDDTTIGAICDLFDLGTPFSAAVPIRGGLSHRMWRLDTDRGAFAVKQMNRDPEQPDYFAWYDRAFSLEPLLEWAERDGLEEPGSRPAA